MVHVDDRVAVHPLKLSPVEALFHGAQGLGGQQTLARCNDPDQFALGLKCQHFIGIEQEVVVAGAADDLARSRGMLGGGDGGDGRDAAGDFDGPVKQQLRPFDGFLEALRGDGLQQVVHGAGLEGLNGVLVEGGDDHDHRQVRAAELADHFEAAHQGHLQIEEDELWLQGGDLVQCLAAIGGFANHLDLRKVLELLVQQAARDGFIVHKQSRDPRAFHMSLSMTSVPQPAVNGQPPAVQYERMPQLNQPLLINILGHAAGALIFAIFLSLLFSGRGWSGSRGRYLSGLAGALSLVWNLGSLAVLAWPGLPPPVLDIAIAVSFSVLSLLPAVLLHVSLEGRRRWLVIAGYLLSAVAIAMHFREIAGNGAKLHQTALLVITLGFLVLAAVAAAGPAVPSRPGRFRILASMCLALFAMSFIHFGTGHAGQAWSSELVVHHAGIPLALFVLLQDYRFVLLDAFIRFLANVLLAAVLSALLMVTVFRLVLAERFAESPLEEALLLMSLCLFLVIFAWLRNNVQRWLTQVVFRRGDVSGLSARVKDCPPSTTEEQYLEWAAALIAAAVRTKHSAVADACELGGAGELHGALRADSLPAARSSKWPWVEAIAAVRSGPGALKLILLGPRQGGQPYLSEDLDSLSRTAAAISERVEALRREEMDRLVSQAELRALQSQINPHFLFNALNTLYGSIPREAAGARRMVLNLAEIFRYFLQSERTFVPLSQEIQIVRAYLEVEQLRLGDRLKVEFQVDEAAGRVPVPVLSIQPLVENAIKHGVAPNAEPGYVLVKAESRADELRISVENSGAAPAGERPGHEVGLRNVRRRLEICYGPGASLELIFARERTVAEIVIPAGQAAPGGRTERAIGTRVAGLKSGAG